MMFQKFLKEALRRKKVEEYDPTNKYQCVDLVLLWLKHLGLGHLIPIGIVRAYAIYKAKKLEKDFERIPNTPNGVPPQGAIVVWDRNYNGGIGHVGVATGKGDVNSFEAVVQNDPDSKNKGNYGVIVRNYNYDHVLGWLKPKKLQIEDKPMEDRRPYWFDLLNKVIWGKPHEEITDQIVKDWASEYTSQRTRSGWYDKIVQYIKDDPNIDSNSVPPDALIKVIAGYKGAAVTNQKELAEMKQIIEEKNKALADQERECQNMEKFYKDLLKGEKVWQSELNQTRGQLKACQLEASNLRVSLKKCEAGQLEYKENVIERLVTVVKEFLNKVLP